MIDNARFTLRRLLERFGPDLVRDPHRLGALLRDECGEYKREISVIMLALEEEVVDALRAAGGGLGVTIPRLAKELHETRALDENAARWAVDTWAHALGLAAAADDDATNETWLDVPVRKIVRADDEARAREAARLREAETARRDAAAREREEAERRGQDAERARQEEERRRRGAGGDAGAAPPRTALVARVLGFFRTPEGKPRWVPIGVALALGAAVLWQGQEPPLRIVEVTHPKQFPANSTDVDFLIRYEGGDVVQIERKVLRGGWRDDTISYKSDGKPAGTAPMKIRASRPEAGAFRLVAIDVKGRRSAPYDVEFEATAPPQPLRITGVVYPRRFPADDSEVEFKVQYEGGDVVKLERKSLRGSWRDHVLNFDPGGGAKGAVTMKLRAKSPERAAFRLTVVDAVGRRSAPYDVEFEATAVGAQGPGTGPARAATLRITGIDHPRQLPLGQQSAFDVFYDGLVGDTVRLEYVSLQGRWGDKTIPYRVDGRAQGRVRLTMTANAPGRGGLRITLIDERGNRSAPQDVYFEAVLAQSRR